MKPIASRSGWLTHLLQGKEEVSSSLLEQIPESKAQRSNMGNLGPEPEMVSLPDLSPFPDFEPQRPRTKDHTPTLIDEILAQALSLRRHS